MFTLNLRLDIHNKSGATKLSIVNKNLLFTCVGFYAFKLKYIFICYMYKMKKIYGIGNACVLFGFINSTRLGTSYFTHLTIHSAVCNGYFYYYYTVSAIKKRQETKKSFKTFKKDFYAGVSHDSSKLSLFLLLLFFYLFCCCRVVCRSSVAQVFFCGDSFLV